MVLVGRSSTTKKFSSVKLCSLRYYLERWDHWPASVSARVLPDMLVPLPCIRWYATITDQKRDLNDLCQQERLVRFGRKVLQDSSQNHLLTHTHHVVLARLVSYRSLPAVIASAWPHFSQPRSPHLCSLARIKTFKYIYHQGCGKTRT